MTIHQIATLLFLFICGHALADFALQTEWVAINKARNARLRYTPEERSKLQIVWPHLLTAHSLHHGLIVFLISQRLSLGIAETVVHWISDFGKCERWFGFHADQFIHIAFKFVWVALIVEKVV